MKTIEYKDDNGTVTTLGAVIITHNLLIEGKIPAMVTSENRFFMQLSPELPMIDKNAFEQIKKNVPIDLMIKYNRYYEAFNNGKLHELWEEPTTSSTNLKA